jgi:hypothetical protein
VGVPRGSEASWIAKKANFHTSIRVLEQELAKVALAERCLVPFFPGDSSRVDSDHFLLFHWNLRIGVVSALGFPVHPMVTRAASGFEINRWPRFNGTNTNDNGPMQGIQLGMPDSI